MRKVFVLFILLATISTAFGEIVILKDFLILRGNLVGKSEYSILLKADSLLFRIPNDQIKHILNNDNRVITKKVNRSKDFVNIDIHTAILTPLSEKKRDGELSQLEYVTEWKVENLFIGGLFTVFAYIYFDKASEISNGIRILKNVGFSDNELDELYSKRTEKIALASFLSAGSLYFLFTSKEVVEVKLTPMSFDISYKF